MDESHYKGGMTRGGRWGMALAALIGAPLLLFLVLVNALGDCDADHGIACKPGTLLNVVLPAGAAMLAVGFTVRWLVNCLARSRA